MSNRMPTQPAPSSALRRLLQPIPGNPSLFSSAGSFSPPVGRFLDPADQIRGYYIDFEEKAQEPHWPPPWLKSRVEQLHVSTAQWGLGAYEKFLKSGREEWLRAATDAAEHLLSLQTQGGKLNGGWAHLHPMPHTYRLDPPWLSAMAQGEGASLLVRIYLSGAEERFADGALRAISPMRIAVEDGGVRAELDERPFLEEYPTEPASYVLNGAMFAIWGLRDVAVGLKDPGIGSEFKELTDGLAASIHRYDLGFWSRYDLYPHRIANVSSGAYHLLHMTQLRAMRIIADRPEFKTTLQTYERYSRSRYSQTRALAQKVLFRTVVPRNRLLGRAVASRR
jgi:heparosan-N-sulfate-glucuronate 5-epimerase